jgi:hypothetical protein
MHARRSDSQIATTSEPAKKRSAQVARKRAIATARIYQHTRPLQPMTLDFLERGNTDDLKRLADLRCLAREALEMASSAGVLRFATIKDHRAWIVTDRTRYLAEARRLDGRPWAHIGNKKSYTLPGASEFRKRWPLGIASISRA